MQSSAFVKLVVARILCINGPHGRSEISMPQQPIRKKKDRWYHSEDYTLIKNLRNRLRLPMVV